MTKKTRSHAHDLRGASALAASATTGVTDLVEAMHHTIGGAPARVLSAPVYGSIRGVAKIAFAGLDFALARLAPLLGESAPGSDREAVVAALNGVLGDYLAETGNPLAIAMRLRVSPPDVAPSRKLVVLVHGSSMNDAQWRRAGHDHGEALARDLGCSPIYVLYNSGLHVSENGRALADALEALVATWPVPVEHIALVGHSMGGLVARSACHYAEESCHAWRTKVDKLVCIGTPHHGAPLERMGSWVDVALRVSRYSAPFAKLGRIRSAGVTDLRFGNVLDEHWQGRDRFVRGADPRPSLALPKDVACYALAGTTAKAQPLRGRIPGDGLVPLDSALGRNEKPKLALRFPEEHQAIAWGTGHLELLGEGTYETIRAWLA